MFTRQVYVGFVSSLLALCSDFALIYSLALSIINEYTNVMFQVQDRVSMNYVRLQSTQTIIKTVNDWTRISLFIKQLYT